MSGFWSTLKREACFLAGAATTAFFFLAGADLLQPSAGLAVQIFCFIWLFSVMLWCAFGVVRHADCLAVILGEPYGTLILTLSVIGI